MDKGYIRLSRSFFDNEIWQAARAFSECEAWLDLIQSARFEASPTTSCIGSYEVTWGRGQYPASVRFLAKKWGRSERWVRTFLGKLKRKGMITSENDQGTSIITLVNFDKYNPLKEDGEKPCDTPSDTLNNLTYSDLQELVTHIVTQQAEKRHTTDTNTKKGEEYNNNLNTVGARDFGCLDELEKKLQQDESWKRYLPEYMFRQTQKMLSPEDINAYISDFIVKLKAEGVTSKTEDDAKRHFTNWIRLELQKQGNMFEATNNALVSFEESKGKSKYCDFLKKVREKAPYCFANMRMPNASEFQEIRKEMSAKVILEIILRIENNKKLCETRNNLYLTILEQKKYYGTD